VSLPFQVVDQRAQSGRRLPAARVLRVNPVEGWCPVLQRGHLAASGEVCGNILLHMDTHAAALPNQRQGEVGRIADQRPLDALPQLTSLLLELPRSNAAAAQPVLGGAGMLVQVTRVRRSAMTLPIVRRGHDEVPQRRADAYSDHDFFDVPAKTCAGSSRSTSSGR